MRYWRLEQPRGGGQLDLTRAARLIAAIGHEDINALAEEMLLTAGNLVPVCQCTIFAYEYGNRPRTIAAASRRGSKFVHDIAEAYVRHFYSLDSNQAIVGATGAEKFDPAILLHRQTSEDIAHEGYRAICYQEPNVSDRVAVLLQPAQRIWLSVNFYRDRDQGNFLPAEIERIEGLATVFAHAARHHYALSGQGQAGISQLMLGRVRSACPDLSKRELDVLRGVLEGRSAAEIAELMGIRPSSVATYQKRAYHRLGISSQRQLFALCLGPGKG
jgi:DNA-binding CsgD family transcriptional regulator